MVDDTSSLGKAEDERIENMLWAHEAEPVGSGVAAERHASFRAEQVADARKWGIERFADMSEIDL